MKMQNIDSIPLRTNTKASTERYVCICYLSIHHRSAYLSVYLSIYLTTHYSFCSFSPSGQKPEKI